MKNRDTNIDCLRGLVMLYIIYVIHGFGITETIPYNSNFFSLLLFEMPIVFFTSGASLKLSMQKPILGFIKSRIYRVVVPFAIWAMIAFVFFSFKGVAPWTYVLKQLLLFDFYQIIPYAWPMWFVIPYLLVSIVGYFLFKGYKKWHHRFIVTYTIIVAIVILVMDRLQINVPFEYNVRYTLVYSIFYAYGFLYKDQINRAWIVVNIVLMSVLYVFLALSPHYSIYTQVNKFPPNFAFICYGLIAVLALLLLLSCVKLRVFGNNAIRCANKYGFEMYLYQNYSSWMSGFVVSTLLAEQPWFIKYMVVIFIITLFLFPVASIMNRIDKKICMGIDKVITQK